MLTRTEVRFFAGYLTLAFHEARNVRHLVSAGLVEKSPFRMLVDGLPANRIDAWKALQPLRTKAAEAATAAAAEILFQGKLKLRLEELAVVSSNAQWAGRLLAGDEWAQIDEALIALRDAIDTRKYGRVAEFLISLPKMAHNTGRLGDKLRMLDEAIGRT